jgi:hypothetical protein
MRQSSGIPTSARSSGVRWSCHSVIAAPKPCAREVDLCANSGERVAVRPGGSYGDWVTNLVVDPYKKSRGRWLSRTGPNTRVMRGCPHSLTSTQLPIRRQWHRITPVTIARYG